MLIIYNLVGILGADPNAMDNHGRTALTITFLILELDNINTIFNNPAGVQIMWANAPPSQQSTIIRGDAEESMFATVVRLLVWYDATPPNGWDKNYAKAPAWLKELYKMVCSEDVITFQFNEKPQSLQHLVRSVIRSQLATVHKLQHISMLPIPKKTINYLRFRYM